MLKFLDRGSGQIKPDTFFGGGGTFGVDGIDRLSSSDVFKIFDWYFSIYFIF